MKKRKRQDKKRQKENEDQIIYLLHLLFKNFLHLKEKEGRKKKEKEEEEEGDEELTEEGRKEGGVGDWVEKETPPFPPAYAYRPLSCVYAVCVWCGVEGAGGGSSSDILPLAC